MEQKSTDELTNELKTATDIEDYLSANRKHFIKDSLSSHLHKLLAEKKLRRADVIRGSMLGRAYVYRIFAGQKIPSRDKLIALAFGMHLSDEETQRMLKLSGNRELYARDERDALILFALQRKMTVMETNSLLFDHRFSILDTTKE